MQKLAFHKLSLQYLYSWQKAGIKKKYQCVIVIKNCSKLFNEIKDMCYGILDTNLPLQTKSLLGDVFISAKCQYFNIFLNQEQITYEQNNFYALLNYSDRMLKAVLDQDFCEAMMIHKQQMQQSGDKVFLWQQLCISQLIGFNLTVKFYTHPPMNLFIQRKKWYTCLAEKEYCLWLDSFKKVNSRIQAVIEYVKRHQAEKKKILEILKNGMLSIERRRETLQFFIYITQKQQIYLRHFQRNRILMKEDLLKLYSELKGIIFQESYVDNKQSSFQDLANIIFQPLQLILDGVQIDKLQQIKQKQNSYILTPCKTREKQSYQMITDLQIFQAVLRKELKKIQHEMSLMANEDNI